VAAWFASIEWRLRMLSNKSMSSLTRKEAEHLIDLKLEAIRVLQKEIRHDVKELNDKIDKLLHLK